MSGPREKRHHEIITALKSISNEIQHIDTGERYEDEELRVIITKNFDEIGSHLESLYNVLVEINRDQNKATKQKIKNKKRKHQINLL